MKIAGRLLLIAAAGFGVGFLWMSLHKTGRATFSSGAVPERLLPVTELNLRPVPQNSGKLNRITILESCAVFDGKATAGKAKSFLSISDFCLDPYDNLYIADQKLNEINVYDKALRLVTTFGKIGQGPGEFLGRLGIHFGLDGFIYVADAATKRISVFSKKGDFVHEIPTNVDDTPAVDAEGALFMISAGNIKAIDRYRGARLEEQLFSLKYHHSFFPERPPEDLVRIVLQTPPTSTEVPKSISKRGLLACVFNHSLTAVIYDNKTKKQIEFRIDHPRLLQDIRERLAAAKIMHSWIFPIGSIFWDNDEHLCLGYFNETLNAPEIYRYSKTGEFFDTLRLENGGYRSNRIVRSCDQKGDFYGLNDHGNSVIRYKLGEGGPTKEGK